LAYLSIPSETGGTEGYEGSMGFSFTVNAPVFILDLGVFNPVGSAPLPTVLSCRLYNMETGELIAQQAFSQVSIRATSSFFYMCYHEKNIHLTSVYFQLPSSSSRRTAATRKVAHFSRRCGSLCSCRRVSRASWPLTVTARTS
jgi:hypothetical protein